MNPQLLFLLESAPTGRIFGLDMQAMITTVITLLNTGILAFVLSYFLYNPVRNYLRKRTERIQNDLTHAATEKASASEMRTQYEAKLRDILAERDDILEAARKQATESSKQIIDEAKAEAETIRDRALRNVQLEQERVKDEMRSSIIELSSAMAERFVARTMDSGTQDKLFTEVMAELKEADFASAGGKAV